MKMGKPHSIKLFSGVILQIKRKNRKKTHFFFYSQLSGNIEVIKVLIENGIDVNRKTFIYGVPALAWAGNLHINVKKRIFFFKKIFQSKHRRTGRHC